MGLKAPLSLDNVKEDDLGNTIRELKEKIAHMKTYQNTETGMLEMQLEALIEQHKLESLQQGE